MRVFSTLFLQWVYQSIHSVLPHKFLNIRIHRYCMKSNFIVAFIFIFCIVYLLLSFLYLSPYTQIDNIIFSLLSISLIFLFSLLEIPKIKFSKILIFTYIFLFDLGIIFVYCTLSVYVSSSSKSGVSFCSPIFVPEVTLIMFTPIVLSIFILFGIIFKNVLGKYIKHLTIVTILYYFFMIFVFFNLPNLLNKTSYELYSLSLFYIINSFMLTLTMNTTFKQRKRKWSLFLKNKN